MSKMSKMWVSLVIFKLSKWYFDYILVELIE